MKKVLLISYYWPPSGGSGVQRPLKFVKYLRDFGWEPIVYTVENPEAPEIDESLLKEIPQGVEVLKTKAFEPYSIYRTLTGKGKNAKINPTFFGKNNKRSLVDKIVLWIRSNIFVPDPRMFWINPSVKYLVEYIKNHPVDAIISTGPPHSMHLIAKGVKAKTGLPWIADFRDPWTNIDYFSELSLSSFALNKHHRLEKSVLNTADEILVVGSMMVNEFVEKTSKPITLIPNGYDAADYSFESEIELDKDFSIVHLGMLGKARNHDAFWKAIAEFIQENELFSQRLKIKLYGKLDNSVQSSVDEFSLQNWVEYHSYVPHQEVVNIQRKAQVLYLPLNDSINAKGILTGKLFEYLAVKRPVLCVGPEDGDAAKVLLDAGAGLIADFTDKDGLKKHLSNYFEKYLNNTLQINSNGVEQYSRKNLTGELSKILDKYK